MDKLLTSSFYRYFSEDLVDPIAVTAGLLQTALYIDFFYVYFTKYVLYLPFRRPLAQRSQSAKRKEVRAPGVNIGMALTRTRQIRFR